MLFICVPPDGVLIDWNILMVKVTTPPATNMNKIIIIIITLPTLKKRSIVRDSLTSICCKWNWWMLFNLQWNSLKFWCRKNFSGFSLCDMLIQEFSGDETFRILLLVSKYQQNRNVKCNLLLKTQTDHEILSSCILIHFRSILPIWTLWKHQS